MGVDNAIGRWAVWVTSSEFKNLKYGGGEGRYSATLLLPEAAVVDKEVMGMGMGP